MLEKKGPGTCTVTASVMDDHVRKYREDIFRIAGSLCGGVDRRTGPQAPAIPQGNGFAVRI